MTTPEMVEIELCVAGEGAKMAGDILLHPLLTHLLAAKVRFLQTLLDPRIHGKGLETI